MLETLKTTLMQQWVTIARWSAIIVFIWLLLDVLRDYLKGGVERRVVSIRWRTLTRKGFRIAPNPREGRRRRRWLNRLSKHPAALVVLGFLLTGVVGNGLVALQEHRQRERESLVKSMNELRAAYDDLSVGFANYYFRGMLLINLQENGASQVAIAEARKAFDAASEKWQERLAADSPTIGTLHENATGDSEVFSITEFIKFDTGLVDDCITNNRPQRDAGSAQYVLQCAPPSKKGVTAQTRLLTLSNCVKFFAVLLRPDPKIDFYISDNSRSIKGMSGVLEEVCSVARYYETPSEMSAALAKAVPAIQQPVSK